MQSTVTYDELFYGAEFADQQHPLTCTHLAYYAISFDSLYAAAVSANATVYYADLMSIAGVDSWAACRLTCMSIASLKNRWFQFYGNRYCFCAPASFRLNSSQISIEPRSASFDLQALDRYCGMEPLLADDGSAICEAGCQPRGPSGCCLPGLFNVSNPAASGTAAPSTSVNGSEPEDNSKLEALTAALSLAVVLDLAVLLVLRSRATSLASRPTDGAVGGSRQAVPGGLAALVAGRLSDAEEDAVVSALMEQHFSPERSAAESEARELEFVFAELGRHYEPPVLPGHRSVEQGGCESDGDDADSVLAFLRAGLGSRPVGVASGREEDEAWLGRCPVCLEGASAALVPLHVVALGCGHRLHRGCLRVYLKHEVRAGRSEVMRCPVLGCDEVVVGNL